MPKPLLILIVLVALLIIVVAFTMWKTRSLSSLDKAALKAFKSGARTAVDVRSLISKNKAMIPPSGDSLDASIACLEELGLIRGVTRVGDTKGLRKTYEPTSVGWGHPTE